MKQDDSRTRRGADSNAAEPHPDRIGPYRILDVLGSGGMAVVYLGVNQLTHQEVAIKMLPPELAAYAEVKTRFLEEARTLAKLEHPNIVHLINFA